MTDLWRDRAEYQHGEKGRCYGCSKECYKTRWGHWCYDCNVARIERISGVLEGELARHQQS